MATKGESKKIAHSKNETKNKRTIKNAVNRNRLQRKSYLNYDKYYNQSPFESISFVLKMQLLITYMTMTL